jgi:hypothetical protein
MRRRRDEIAAVHDGTMPVLARSTRLLRAFGCEVGVGLVHGPPGEHTIPLEAHDRYHGRIGERTEILNLKTVTREDHCRLSQDVYLTGAGYDSSSASMTDKNRPFAQVAARE